MGQTLDSLDIFVSEGENFEVKLLDPSIGYGLTFYTEEAVNKWLAKCNMSYYQNQLNFAVYCASTLCGLPDLGKNRGVLINSVYQFHFYYQVRKILKQLQVPLPTDPAFKPLDNNINKTMFTRLCNEFRVSPTTDFRTKRGDNYGLGSIIMDGSLISGNGFINHRKHFALPDKHYTFAQSLHIAKIQKIKQGNDGWKYFIHPKDKLTAPGIQRLNDSIRTYVYCILGAQAETRTAITGSFGTELDAQKQFLKLLNDSIDKHADVSTSIERYQKAITDTHVRLDYVIGPGLYIISSDMVLKVGNIENYNNNIQIATQNMKTGRNDINNEKRRLPQLMEGSPVKTFRTRSLETRSLETKAQSDEINKEPVHSEPRHMSSASPDNKEPNIINQDKTHQDIKFALYGVTSALVGVALYLR